MDHPNTELVWYLSPHCTKHVWYSDRELLECSSHLVTIWNHCPLLPLLLKIFTKWSCCSCCWIVPSPMILVRKWCLVLLLPVLEFFAELRSGVVPALPFVGLIAGRTIVMIQTDLGLKKRKSFVTRQFYIDGSRAVYRISSRGSQMNR